MRFDTWTRLLVLTAIVSLLLPGIVLAQSTTTGAISGVVTDPSGAVLPDVSVTLKSTEKGFTTTAKTNAQGFYQFSLVEPGTYSVTVAAPSFKTQNSTTTVSVGQNSIVNAKLEVGAAGTTVEVSGEAPLLQTESAEIATTFNQREITEVPNPGNDLTFIAQTAAGSVMNTGSGYGNFSNFGLSASSNLFTLNGMYDNDPFLNVNNSGATNLLLGQNEVQEATVITNGYSGQYGGFVGANINYITKSGSNNWHGNANYFWNGRVMNANDYFHTDFSDPSNDLPRGFVNANQYAASFGGPIIKNKAYFFWNYEGLRVLIPVTNEEILTPTPAFENAILDNLTSPAVGMAASVPFYQQAFNVWNGAPGISKATPGNPNSSVDTSGCQGSTFVDPGGAYGTAGATFGLGTGLLPCTQSFSNTVGNFTHEYLTSGRFDFNVTNNDKLFVRLQEDIGTQATATDALNPIFNSTSYQPEYQGQIGWNRALGLKAANNLLVSDQYYRAIFGPLNLQASLATFPTTLFLDDGSLHTVGGDDFVWPQGRNVTGYQVVDDFSYILNSKHTLKLGIYFHRNDLSDHDMGILSSGEDVAFSLQSFYNLGAAYTGGQGFVVQSFPSSLDQPVKLYQLGWYVQDEWKPRNDLKLTLALRMDHNELPICNTNCFARLSGPFPLAGQNVGTPYNQAITTGLANMAPSFSKVVFQPRLGFAWSPSFAHNTVFRGGIGIFMDTFQGSVADSLIENTPYDNTFVAGGNIAPQETNMGNAFATASGSNTALVNGFFAGQNLNQLQLATGGLFSPPNITTVGNIVAPQTQEWNFEVQHQFGNNTSIIVNYVGSHGEYLTMPFNGVNGYCPTSTCPYGFNGLPAAAPDSRFVTVTDIRTNAISNYNGLSLSVQHRFAHGLQLQANYLYGHALDEVSNGGLNPFIDNGYGNSIQNPVNDNNLRASYGNADYDTRHSFNANYVYEIPKGPTFALKGWQLSGTVFFRTGFPYTPTNASAGGILSTYGFGTGAGPVYANYAGSGHPNCSGPSGALDTGITPCIPLSGFPDIAAGNAINPATVSPSNPTGSAYGVGQAQLGYLNSGVTGTGPGYTGGEYGQERNQFYGPRYFDTDMTIMKYTQIPHWETAKFGIGAQFFNLFNHPNFASPYSDESNPAFGQVLSTVNPPTSILGSFLGGDASTRLIQLTAKFNF
jgi:Carboxypeptidase regulatory-like domain